MMGFAALVGFKLFERALLDHAVHAIASQWYRISENFTFKNLKRLCRNEIFHSVGTRM